MKSQELPRENSVANLRTRLDASFSSVSYFVQRFNFMEDKLNEIENEFAHYQIDEQVDSLVETGLETKRADEMWVQISLVKDRATGQLHYQYLPKVMQLILSISHSNAEDERICTVVRKNATEFRSNF